MEEWVAAYELVVFDTLSLFRKSQTWSEARGMEILGDRTLVHDLQSP